jgi:hypothetical protein
MVPNHQPVGHSQHSRPFVFFSPYSDPAGLEATCKIDLGLILAKVRDVIAASIPNCHININHGITIQ